MAAMKLKLLGYLVIGDQRTLPSENLGENTDLSDTRRSFILASIPLGIYIGRTAL
jgi:hypothetical protein